MNIKEWALADRPREKLYQQGPKQLTTAELLAIILGNGTRNQSAVALAKSILAKAENNLDKLAQLSIADLTSIKGVGPAKSITIKALMELSNRKNATTPLVTGKITSSQDAFSILENHYADLQVEEFWVIYLNRANKVISATKLSTGGVSATIVDPKLIFHQALAKLATGIIISHNHPSGNLKPSQQDIALTNKIKTAAKNLDINLLDHLIVAGNNYYSFADEGKL